MANKNTEYEQLTQAVYQAICNADGYRNISVEHNKRLAGKSGCNHQIDVYWEFEMMGVTHRVAIECKNYAKEISVGKIRDFFGVLHDIGNIEGVFVTKVGYQRGAKKLAKYYGILLQELRPPTEEDWRGRIKDVHGTLIFLSIDIKSRDFHFDIEWLFANTDLKEGDVIPISCQTDEITINDLDVKTTTTLHDLENALPRDASETNKVFEKKFDNAFVILPTGKKFKINGISYLYDVISESQKIVTRGNDIVRAIIKNVDSGAIKVFDQCGNIRDVRNPKKDS